MSESVNNQNNTEPTRTLNVRVYCRAYYDSEIEVPANMTIEEAFAYAKEHLPDISLTELEYIPDSDSLDEEDLASGDIDFDD